MGSHKTFIVRFTWPNGDHIDKDVRATWFSSAKQAAIASLALTTRNLIRDYVITVKAAELDKDGKPTKWL